MADSDVNRQQPHGWANQPSGGTEGYWQSSASSQPARPATGPAWPSNPTAPIQDAASEPAEVTAAPEVVDAKTTGGKLGIALGAFILLFIIVVAYLMLRGGGGEGGSTGGSGGTTAPGNAAVVFHGEGYDSAFLHPGYAQGYDLTPPGPKPLGFSSDRVTGAYYSIGEYVLDGRDFANGDIVWSIPEMQCSDDAVMDGTAYCTQRTSSGFYIQAIDLTDGEMELVYGAAFPIYDVRPIGEYDGAIILQTTDNDGERVLSMRNGGAIDWQLLMPANVMCTLLEDHVSCADTEGLSIVDAETGDVTLDWTSTNGERLVNLLDGWYTMPMGVSDQAITVDVRDFDGKSMGEVTDPSMPLTPSADQGFLFPLSDIKQGVFVNAVLKDGSVFTEIGDGLTFKKSGKAIESGHIAAVSSKGEVAWLSDATHGGLYDANGELIQAMEGDTWDYQVVDGVLVYMDASYQYQLLIPKG